MYQKHLCYHYTMGTPKMTAAYYTPCEGVFATRVASARKAGA